MMVRQGGLLWKSVRMPYVLCCLLFSLTPGCKESGTGKDSDAKQNSHQGLRLSQDSADETLARTFDSSAQDIYTMNRQELQRVPPSDLLREIRILELRNQSEKKELLSLKSFNRILCQRLARLEQDCVAHLYITDDHGLDELNCTNQESGSPIPPPDIKVELINGEGLSYVLIADSLYMTNEFTGNVSTSLSFRRTDNKVVRPPRFRDLESLKIAAVRPGSAQIVDGHISLDRDTIPPLSSGFGIRISINGKALMKDSELVAPDDPHDNWYYRISPEGLLTLGQSPSCQVTLKELRELQQQVEQ
ncbi:MAG: hypothetical protein H6618_09925 [Deltaproteobacteria bacterium]|nr:hypothetical protein [Deltaproteobacteria bacterium]